MLDKIDEFLRKKGQEIYDQAKRDLLNDPRMAEQGKKLEEQVQQADHFFTGMLADKKPTITSKAVELQFTKGEYHCNTPSHFCNHSHDKARAEAHYDEFMRSHRPNNKVIYHFGKGYRCATPLSFCDKFHQYSGEAERHFDEWVKEQAIHLNVSLQQKSSDKKKAVLTDGGRFYYCNTPGDEYCRALHNTKEEAEAHYDEWVKPEKTIWRYGEGYYCATPSTFCSHTHKTSREATDHYDEWSQTMEPHTKTVLQAIRELAAKENVVWTHVPNNIFVKPVPTEPKFFAVPQQPDNARKCGYDCYAPVCMHGYHETLGEVKDCVAVWKQHKQHFLKTFGPVENPQGYCCNTPGSFCQELHRSKELASAHYDGYAQEKNAADTTTQRPAAATVEKPAPATVELPGMVWPDLLFQCNVPDCKGHQDPNQCEAHWHDSGMTHFVIKTDKGFHCRTKFGFCDKPHRNAKEAKEHYVEWKKQEAAAAIAVKCHVPGCMGHDSKASSEDHWGQAHHKDRIVVAHTGGYLCKTPESFCKTAHSTVAEAEAHYDEFHKKEIFMDSKSYVYKPGWKCRCPITFCNVIHTTQAEAEAHFDEFKKPAPVPYDDKKVFVVVGWQEAEAHYDQFTNRCCMDHKKLTVCGLCGWTKYDKTKVVPVNHGLEFGYKLKIQPPCELTHTNLPCECGWKPYNTDKVDLVPGGYYCNTPPDFCSETHDDWKTAEDHYDEWIKNSTQENVKKFWCIKARNGRRNSHLSVLQALTDTARIEGLEIAGLHVDDTNVNWDEAMEKYPSLNDYCKAYPEIARNAKAYWLSDLELISAENQRNVDQVCSTLCGCGVSIPDALPDIEEVIVPALPISPQELAAVIDVSDILPDVPVEGVVGKDNEEVGCEYCKECGCIFGADDEVCHGCGVYDSNSYDPNECAVVNENHEIGVAKNLTPSYDTVESKVPALARKAFGLVQRSSVSLLEGFVMKSFLKVTYGAVAAALLILVGPGAWEKAVRYWEGPPLSPLAKVVVERLDGSANWQLTDSGIQCDIIILQGEDGGRKAVELSSSDAKSVGVWSRNASLTKDVPVGDQLRPHEVKVILPKAKEMYEKLLAEKNLQTAQAIQNPKPAPVEPVKNDPVLPYTKNGISVYTSLNKANWKLDGHLLLSKNGKATIDPTKETAVVNDGKITTAIQFGNGETKIIMDKARTVREELLQDLIHANLPNDGKQDAAVQKAISELGSQR